MKLQFANPVTVTIPPRSSTMDLLRFALDGGDSTREISRKLGLSSNALNVARSRGRLSPTAAGMLAAHLGRDPLLWMAIAAAEAEPAPPQKEFLLERIANALNSDFATLRASRRRRLQPAV